MNVWLFIFTTAKTERYMGPFTSLVFTPERIEDSLTGREVAVFSDGRWVFGWDLFAAERLVVQQGGFESPWGDRGRKL